MKHQYELLNHRTNWFIGINAFLLTTYGFTIQKKLEVTRSPQRIPDDFLNVMHKADAFLLAISIFGLMLSCLAYPLLQAAIKPIYQLDNLFRELGQQADKISMTAEAPQAKARIPNIIGGLNAKTRGPRLTAAIPALLFFTWLAIILFTTDFKKLFFW